MGGALQAVNNFISAIQPAAAVAGVGAMVSAVEGIEATASKLMEASKTANPAEKVAIDKKLGDLSREAQSDMANATGLISNAAAKGDPGALSAMANLQKMQEAHALFEMYETLKKMEQALGHSLSKSDEVRDKLDKALGALKSPL